jgi:glycosyl transferase family 25
MQIKDFFERVYVINLPYRKDRYRQMAQELEKAGMPLSPNKVEIFPAIRPNDAINFPSVGALGCFLSHLSILKQAKKDGLANVLILEDDLVISERFRTDQALIVEQLRSVDWGFVYFGHREEVAQASPVKLDPFSDPIITTHFYAVNGNILERLLWFLEELQLRPAGHPDGGPMHLDGAYSTFRMQNPDIITLIASPNLGWQRSSRSDIHANAWFDRIPVFKQLAGVTRGGKAWLLNRHSRL